MTVMNGRMNGKKDYVKPEELIVNELIQALESGNTKLWRKEWTVKAVSGMSYQGISIKALTLLCSVYRVLLGIGTYHFL